MKQVMKLFSKMLLCIMAALFVFTSCELLFSDNQPDEKEEAELIVSSSKKVVVDPEGEILMVEFYSSLKWNLQMSFPSGDKWLSADQTSGTKGDFAITVKAQPNFTGQARNATMQITTDEISATITFSQESAQEQPSFMILSDNATVAAEGGTIEVDLIASVSYEVKVMDEWLREVEVKTTNQYKHIFEIDPNTVAEERRAVISFCADGSCIPYTVTQAAAEVVPPTGDDDDDDEPDFEEWNGIVETGWEDKPFHHRSLAMRFTSSGCGYCPMMAEALSLAKEYLSGNLEVVSMHGYGNLVFVSCDPLTSLYGISNYPTGIIDGMTEVRNYSSIDYTASLAIAAAELTEDTFETVTSAGWVSEIIDKKIKVSLTAYVKEPGEYKITALVVEDDYVAPQAHYQYGSYVDNYIHNGLPKKALSPIEGESFSTTSANETVKFTYIADLPAGLADNMRVVVYIQRPLGEYEYLATYDYGGYFVDNSMTAKLGTTRSIDFTDSGNTEDITQGDDIDIR